MLYNIGSGYNNVANYEPFDNLNSLYINIIIQNLIKTFQVI